MILVEAGVLDLDTAAFQQVVLRLFRDRLAQVVTLGDLECRPQVVGGHSDVPQ